MVAITYTESVGTNPDWTMVRPNQEVFNYVQNAAMEAVKYLATPAKEMYEKAKDIYQLVNYSTAVRKARAAIRQVENKTRVNEVTELSTIGQLQHASPIMQRFIMADPIARAMYQEDSCSGYADSYVDMHRDKIGVDHYDYRRVMNGIWHEDQDSGNIQMHTFYEDTEGDVELDTLAQMDIIRTWDFVRARLKAGKEDPTSPYNEML